MLWAENTAVAKILKLWAENTAVAKNKIGAEKTAVRDRNTDVVKKSCARGQRMIAGKICEAPCSHKMNHYEPFV